MFLAEGGGGGGDGGVGGRAASQCEQHWLVRRELCEQDCLVVRTDSDWFVHGLKP